MASKKISELDAVPSVDGTEAFPVVKSGLNYKVTLNAVKSWIGVATQAAQGLMSAADKLKLDGIAAGATVNDSNAALRDRSTHTGTQPASSVTGLAAVATTGAYSDILNTPDLSLGALGAAPASHVGSGGAAAHPDATSSLSGFMNPVEKASVANIVPAAQVHRYQEVAAAGTDQAAATEVVNSIVRVTSSDATNDAIKLPAGVSAGTMITIKNGTANSVQLFPATGGQVNFQGVDTAVSMSAYGTFRALSIGSDLWDQL